MDLFTNARLSPDSHTNRLTDKQIDLGCRIQLHGDYISRRVDTFELARKLKIGNAAFVMHRRKAEEAMLGELLAGA